MARTDWRLFLRDAPVVEVTKKKRGKTAADGKAKKRRYSGGAMHVLGVGERRVVGGVAEAAAAYLERSKKSASKRKDGALRDLVKNVVKAQEKASGQLAKLPRDLVKTPEVKRTFKRVRRTLRRFSL